jgi:chemotaxis protein CheZ
MDAPDHAARIRRLEGNCRELTRYIAVIRNAVSELRLRELRTTGLPGAAAELGEVVRETESATDRIMTAVEEILGADLTGADPDTAAKVGEAACRVLEACSFQDITGQRLNKIAHLLGGFQSGLDRMLHLLGSDIEDAPPKPKTKEQALLKGPQLEGEGIGQDDVDKLVGKPAA